MGIFGFKKKSLTSTLCLYISFHKNAKKAERLHNKVEYLLDFSSFEAGAEPTRGEPVDLVCRFMMRYVGYYLI